jgi:hypothetical protein
MIKFCYRRRQICSTIAIIARYLQWRAVAGEWYFILIRQTPIMHKTWQARDWQSFMHATHSQTNQQPPSHWQIAMELIKSS